MFIALLGRQPELSIAELQAVFGRNAVKRRATQVAMVNTDHINITALGGTVKCGVVLHELPAGRNDKGSLIATATWLQQQYVSRLVTTDGKITLGISAYGLSVTARDVQKTGLLLKSTIKRSGVSVRLIPNSEPALSTATSHNNKLGLSPKKRELFIVAADNGKIIIAESRGTQNITAYARRDRERPRRDAFVGMLPPKLAQMMVNMAVGALAGAATTSPLTASRRASADARAADCSGSCITAPARRPTSRTILDPFCGTGTVLQEALLKDYSVYGSDISPKMIDYTTENLAWLQATHRGCGHVMTIRQGDATTHQWPEASSLDAVVCETYLGQPFSAPPRPEKLKEVVGNCNHIISGFLRNIHNQLRPGTPLCIAVPSWQAADGHFTRLPLTRQLAELGYTQLNTTPLRYHRPGQVVARDILLLRVAQKAA
ncbi:MAG: methyltransferase domain-containing protein [Candidatus Saccharibacteria bacterium]|nr:methyltransferase domain-containing protein [Candidatus Saccharibacteria bacterium]